jgi:hypothetical protein
MLNAAGVETLFPKEAMSLSNPTFCGTVKIDEFEYFLGFFIGAWNFSS